VLRAYQQDGGVKIRAAFAAGAKRVLYVAPTGSGKTVLFAYVVAGAVARGNSVVIVGHRQEIVDQIGVAHCRGVHNIVEAQVGDVCAHFISNRGLKRHADSCERAGGLR
jgi:superfamily II DNA or RNA helicase